MLNEKADEKLVEEICGGDIGAFEILVKRYQKPLYFFVLRIIKNDLVVEDIVQETFFKIYKTIDRVDTKRKFSTYVFEIAKNTAISYLRKFKKQVSINDLEIPFEASHYNELLKTENINLVNRALLKIQKKYRKIIDLYYFEELSYNQIADKLGIPINTVRTQLRRGKKAMEVVLKKI